MICKTELFFRALVSGAHTHTHKHHVLDVRINAHFPIMRAVGKSMGTACYAPLRPHATSNTCTSPSPAAAAATRPRPSSDSSAWRLGLQKDLLCGADAAHGAVMGREGQVGRTQRRAERRRVAEPLLEAEVWRRSRKQSKRGGGGRSRNGRMRGRRRTRTHTVNNAGGGGGVGAGRWIAC